MKEWLKAFLVAIGLLIVLHLFVIRLVTVESTSMFATLLPGDLLLVERWAVHSGFDRGDIVVFRDPLKDQDPMGKRPLLVKRIAGMPGDKIQIREGDLFVNGAYIPAPETGTSTYLLRLRKEISTDSLFVALGIPESLIGTGENALEVPLNENLAGEIEGTAALVSVAAIGTATGAPRHMFPFSQNFKWNSDEFGPIEIPARGDTIEITMHNFPIYDRLISIYEGHELSVNSDQLLIDGRPLTEYVVEGNYYFVLGDSRHHSADSRFWGFVPEDHLIGRGSMVLISKGTSGLRNGRTLLTL